MFSKYLPYIKSNDLIISCSYLSDSTDGGYFTLNDPPPAETAHLPSFISVWWVASASVTMTWICGETVICTDQHIAA